MAATNNSSSSPSPSGPNTTHFIKLSESNYLLWLSQIKPFLVGHDLWQYIDESNPAPVSTTTTTSSNPTPVATTTNTFSNPTSDPPNSSSVTATTLTLPNPDFLLWYKQDQIIVSYLTSTLSEPVLALTVDYDTSKEIWDCLQTHFAQKSIASAANLHFQLFDMTKGTKIVD
ncbi:uncharacterized protein LOC110766050 [Prunus avium]|uniref:Uncharacterized protein LOC110766050 n=1 Tax=Prunus avium TaxID=42229 RepID=A0A6P5TD79_PRUAV|nr:uncharacterized protein LOC110766050 [Prunus avium]